MKLREQILNRLSALVHSSASIIFGEDFWGAQLLSKFAKMKGVKIMVDEYIPEPTSLEEAQEQHEKAKKNLKDFEEKNKENFPSLDLPPGISELPKLGISQGLLITYRKLVAEVIRTANNLINWKKWKK